MSAGIVNKHPKSQAGEACSFSVVILIHHGRAGPGSSSLSPGFTHHTRSVFLSGISSSTFTEAPDSIPARQWPPVAPPCISSWRDTLVDSHHGRERLILNLDTSNKIKTDERGKKRNQLGQSELICLIVLYCLCRCSSLAYLSGWWSFVVVGGGLVYF